MENIDILIYSSPKTAGNMLQINLIHHGYKLYYTHDSHFFTGDFPGQQHKIPLKEYILNQSNNKKLTIITVYREFVERIRSLFFEAFKYLYNKPYTTINDVPTEELISYFNENILSKYATGYLSYLSNHNSKINEGFFESFPEEIPNLFSNFNDESKSYACWETGNIRFIVLKFNNMEKWPGILSNIFNKQITLYKNANNSEKKDYYKKYTEFKKLYTLPDDIYQLLYKKNGHPTLFSSCLTQNEQKSFFVKNVYKTLIGKNGYLFLQNDSSKELLIHNDNYCTINKNFMNKYNSVKNKMLLIVYPNKSFICKEFLPDGYDLKYRPGFDLYKEYFTENIIDGVDVLKDVSNIFYKTDSHINLKGSILMYYSFLEKIKNLFQVEVQPVNLTVQEKVVSSLTELDLGIGDLTWDKNIYDQLLDSKEDVYYFSTDFKEIYLRYTISVDDPLRLLVIENNSLVDKTDSSTNTLISWDTLLKFVLFKINPGKPSYKCLIFCDSFLLSTLGLYLEMFERVYLSKSVFKTQLVEIIKPDYIFEFRIERFLS